MRQAPDSIRVEIVAQGHTPIHICSVYFAPIHNHPDLSKPNMFSNASSKSEVPSLSGDSSYILQPASNYTTLHFSSSVIQMIMDSSLKLYGEAYTVIPNSLPCLSNYFFI